MNETTSTYTNLELHESHSDGGVALALRDAVRGNVIGSVNTIDADKSGFPPLAPIAKRDLAFSAFASKITAAPGTESDGVRLLLLYLALRQARRNGKKTLICSLEPHAPDYRLLGFEPIPRAPKTVVAEIQRASFKVFESLPEAAAKWAGEHLLTQELEATVRARCAAFYNNAFFRSIFDGTITKNQYIDSVANNHQFVRWTTRLLGGIIGATADRTLRKSHIEHLSGEIDRELLLENDLSNLGADVEWVKTSMVPNVDIQQFMCVQESMNAFHQDPVLFLAVPFSIEGLTAFMGQNFMEQLKKCIANWGIERRSAACTFLASHIEYVGGDDGHWEGSRRMFQRFLRREQDLQRVLNVVHMVLNSVGRAYESYVAAPDLTAN